MKTPFVAALLAALLLVLPAAQAECCFPHCVKWVNGPEGPMCLVEKCGDGTEPTPYCGYGKCNIFGCNCDGGCRTASKRRLHMRKMI
ncbi:Diedel [Chlorella sorokiniana]|uniref:Diedel n=1 Tax=Chlorella sorokiniana TaxID=3076 RepID=A0A2P6TJR4_CHLSO|nr:Diedel [Chlorella sorokiniana]|eukprot:PRW44326.1 Diedel [Chlorella sorokiniana]